MKKQLIKNEQRIKIEIAPKKIYTNVQQAYEKMHNITNHQKNIN